MEISDRVKSMKYSAIRKLNPYAAEAERQGKEVLHLNIGAPDVHTPKEFFKAIESFDQKTLGYPMAVGMPELRGAISDYFKDLDMDFSPDDIVITAGASEALFFALFAVYNPGDNIVTSDPYYANYNSFLIEADIGLNTYPSKREDAFALADRETIENAIDDRTRAILVCNPANPTGALLKKEEIEMLKDIALDHDLYIIADEIYRDFIYDTDDFTSFAEYKEAEDNVIIMDSISKRYSACGARIGAIMSKNKEIMAAMRKLATARLAVPTLEQIGAASLYRMKNSYLKEVNKEYHERRDLVYELLSKIEGVETYKSQGAFYTVAKLPVEDTDDFAKWLLTDFSHEDKTVMVAPASGFYHEEGRGKDEVRIAFAVSQEDIKSALGLLDLALKEYKAR